MDDMVVQTAQCYQDVRPLVTCSQEIAPNQALAPFHPHPNNLGLGVFLFQMSDVIIERSSFVVRLVTICVK